MAPPPSTLYCRDGSLPSLLSLILRGGKYETSGRDERLPSLQRPASSSSCRDGSLPSLPSVPQREREVKVLEGTRDSRPSTDLLAKFGATGVSYASLSFFLVSQGREYTVPAIRPPKSKTNATSGRDGRLLTLSDVFCTSERVGRLPSLPRAAGTVRTPLPPSPTYSSWRDGSLLSLPRPSANIGGTGVSLCVYIVLQGRESPVPRRCWWRNWEGRFLPDIFTV